MSWKARVAYERRRIAVFRRLGPIILSGVVASGVLSAVMGGLVSSMGSVVSVGANEALVFVLSRGSMMPLTAGLAAAILIGAEFRHRTIEVTLALTARRLRVVAAYLFCQAVLAIILALLGASIALCATITVGYDPSPAFATAMVAVHTLTCVVWSVWGTSLTLIVRSRGAAVFIVSVWALVIEPAVGGAGKVAGGIARDLSRYLPFDLLDALTTSLAPRGGVLLATSAHPPLFAVLLGLSLITGLLLAASITRVQRLRRV